MVNIVDVRDVVVPIPSDISNAFIDFSSMTVSVVAVVTDVSLLRSLKCEAHRTALVSGDQRITGLDRVRSGREVWWNGCRTRSASGLGSC